MSKIAITGMGIISSIGDSPEACYEQLIKEQSGIGELTLFTSIHSKDIKVGEIAMSNEDLIQLLQIPADNTYTRTSLIGAYAAKQALDSAGVEHINAYRTGLISSTSVGGMDVTEKYFDRYLTEPALRKYISSHDAGDSSNKIASYLGLQGFVSTISTACSSAANAIMLGAELIRCGKLDRVIVGGTDALSKFTINGFKTLMILSDSYNTPFDENRKGLNLGEAAAYLVLESDRVIEEESKKVLGYVSGYGNANDAYHQTASSENGDGAYLAMQKAFKMAKLAPNQIDYINVHGTATPNNDLSEGKALLRIYESEQIPDFSSTKAFTGHTLAAAAAIEAVFSILALQYQTVFANLNFKTPMKEFDLIPNVKTKSKNINHILSNSFGFGGNCSTLIFSK